MYYYPIFQAKSYMIADFSVRKGIAVKTAVSQEIPNIPGAEALVEFQPLEL
jgi:hypothetical protein